MEKILKIEEKKFKTKDSDWSSYDGFEITTNLQVIRIGISDYQSCCENYGCIITNDDCSDFINAELKSIEIVDEILDHKIIEPIDDLYEGGAMFVNLETSEGLLQFVAYNAHNGYYGHDAVLLSKQLNHEETL